MKKIIIAVFIVIATLGIAAGTTAKKAPVKTTTKKSTSTPKNEVTDPYVGWWFHEDENFDILSYITKENGKYYSRNYVVYEKAKGQVFCRMYMGRDNNELTKEDILDPELALRRATKDQVETLKYNLDNMKGWMKEPCGE